MKRRFVCPFRAYFIINFSGSLVKKSKNLGIKVEELKLPPVTDFASGQ